MTMYTVRVKPASEQYERPVIIEAETPDAAAVEGLTRAGQGGVGERCRLDVYLGSNGYYTLEERLLRAWGSYDANTATATIEQD